MVVRDPVTRNTLDRSDPRQKSTSVIIDRGGGRDRSSFRPRDRLAAVKRNFSLSPSSFSPNARHTWSIRVDHVRRNHYHWSPSLSPFLCLLVDGPSYRLIAIVVGDLAGVKSWTLAYDRSTSIVRESILLPLRFSPLRSNTQRFFVISVPLAPIGDLGRKEGRIMMMMMMVTNVECVVASWEVRWYYVMIIGRLHVALHRIYIYIYKHLWERTTNWWECTTGFLS